MRAPAPCSEKAPTPLRAGTPARPDVALHLRRLGGVIVVPEPLMPLGDKRVEIVETVPRIVSNTFVSVRKHTRHPPRPRAAHPAVRGPFCLDLEPQQPPYVPLICSAALRPADDAAVMLAPRRLMIM
jgi:hypothetical protein